KASLGRRLIVQRKAGADQQLIQARGLALDPAQGDMPLLVDLVGAEIVAADNAAADDLDERLARVEPAGPGICSLIDAGLVELGGIGALETIGDVAELDGIAV